MAVFRAKEDLIGSKFLHYSLKAEYYQKQVELMWSYGTQQNIGMRVLEQLKLILPPLSEQKAIAEWLDERTERIDRIIATREKQIELLEEMKSAVISRSVTKGLNPDAKMKDSGIEWIGNVPEHWEIAPLKRCSNIVLGKMLMSAPPKGEESWYSEEFYLKSRNIGMLELKLQDIDKMWFNKKEKEIYLLKEGDLVINEGGDIGKVAAWKNQEFNCYIQNSVHKLTPLGNSNTLYLQYYLHFVAQKGYLWSIVSQISIAHLTKEKLSSTPTILPPLPEQQEIVSYLDRETEKIEKRIGRLRRQIELLKEYKATLISEAVTGKIKVKCEN